MKVREKIQFVKDLQKNRRDFENIFIMDIIEFMRFLWTNSIHLSLLKSSSPPNFRKFRFWSFQPDHDSSALFTKCLTHFMFYFALVYFTSALVYLFLHPHEVPPDIFVQKFAHFIVIYVGLYIMHTSRYYRKEFTEVVHFVNEKTKQVLQREDLSTHRPLRNTIYISTVFILLLTCIAGFSPPSTYVYEAIKNGRVYFTSYLPIGKTPFSVAAYLHTATQVLLFYYVYSYCTMFIIVIVEPFLRLSMFYRIVAHDIRALRKAPGFTELGEYTKLRNLMQEFNEISQ